MAGNDGYVGEIVGGEHPLSEKWQKHAGKRIQIKLHSLQGSRSEHSLIPPPQVSAVPDQESNSVPKKIETGKVLPKGAPDSRLGGGLGSRLGSIDKSIDYPEPPPPIQWKGVFDPTDSSID